MESVNGNLNVTNLKPLDKILEVIIKNLVAKTFTSKANCEQQKNCITTFANTK